jgi:two-component system chemotaxis response regulator CheB
MTFNSSPILPPLRIMIVDDSAIVRGMLSRRLGEQSDFQIISTSVDGQMAVEELGNIKVDVIILDLEMPRMDGFTALPEIRRLAPLAKIIISSSLTERNADAALRALSMGANDYVTKPTSRQSRDHADRYYDEMVEKIRALTNRQTPSAAVVAPVATTTLPPTPMVEARPASPRPPATLSEFADGIASSPSQLLPVQRPQVLAVASSTGGPQALLQVFGEARQCLAGIPVFVTQHMPPTFTAILAKHIHQASGIECREGEEGDAIQPGTIYIAPGDYHMRLRKEAEGPRIRLSQDAPINYCRPAADPMISSLVEIYGSRMLLLVLTGMGHDGMDGARMVMEAGGTVVAQDKASSTVWGMPKAVAENGYCKGLLALPQFSQYLQLVFGGGR